MAPRREVLDSESLRLLEEAGFEWDNRLGMFFNLVLGRAISLETVRVKSPEWLRGWLAQYSG